MLQRRIVLMLGLTAMILAWVILMAEKPTTSVSQAEGSQLSAPVLMSTMARTEPVAPGPEHLTPLRELEVPEAPYRPSPILPSPASSPEKELSTAAFKEPKNPYAYEVQAYVTGYCPCARCCGRFANGRTATHTSAWHRGIAVDPKAIPYGSRIEVPGYGIALADDTGIAMRRNWQRRGVIHLDLRFTYHWQARKWGTRQLTVRVIPPAAPNQIVAGRQ